MNKIYEYYNYIIILLISITITVCIICFYFIKNNTYMVTKERILIGYVENKKQFKQTNDRIEKDLKKRFAEIIINNNFDFNRVSVPKDYIISSNKIERLILDNIWAKGYTMKLDDKEIVLVSSINQGEEILRLLSNYYQEKFEIKNTKSIKVKNKVSYVKTVGDISEFHTSQEIANSIIKYNNKNIEPLINLEIIGYTSIEEKITHKVSLVSTEKLWLGEKKLKNRGTDGVKKINKKITLNNCKITEEEVLYEEIIKEPVKDVFLVGTKNPIIDKCVFLKKPCIGWISSPYGMRNGKLHKGIDIAADMKTSIKAALDGIVIFTGWQNGYGKVIIIDHGNGIETLYAHCSDIKVEKHQKVKTNDEIGNVGNTGRSTGPHLHFELRFNGISINPISYLKEN